MDVKLDFRFSEKIDIGTYSVFFLIRPQKRGCCELVFGLLRSPLTSMSPQDQAQITFRSEILHNGFEIELGRW